MGYNSSFKLLDARDFGLPQARQRYFTVSCLGGEVFDFDKMEYRKMQNIWDFIEEETDGWYTIKIPSMLKAIGAKGVIKRVPIIQDYCYTITERPDRTPSSGCIDLHNGQYRYLTEKECWRLQGYSDNDFKAAAEVNSRRALYKQAGNSIPVPIFEEMFKAMGVCDGKINIKTLF